MSGGRGVRSLAFHGQGPWFDPVRGPKIPQSACVAKNNNKVMIDPVNEQRFK